MFEFKKVKPFDTLLKADMPYVLFATPGKLHGGSSMQVFKECVLMKETPSLFPATASRELLETNCCEVPRK